jgi:hypothetical protein
VADNFNPPIRGKQFIFGHALPSQADPRLHQVNPTLAIGDVKVAQLNGGTIGAFANIATLPVVEPAGGANLKVTLSASEMSADGVIVRFSDVAGAEWCDQQVTIHPTDLIIAGSVNDAGPTASAFNTTLTQPDNHFNSAFLTFTGGNLAGQSRKISTYAISNGRIVLSSAFTQAPANGDPFEILGRSE